MRGGRAMNRAIGAVLLSASVAAGCGGGSVPAPAAGGAAEGPTVGKAAVGEWVVVKVDGKPVTEGSILVDYRPDGELILFHDPNVKDGPRIDSGKLKSAFDRAGLAGATFSTLHATAPGLDV